MYPEDKKKDRDEKRSSRKLLLSFVSSFSLFSLAVPFSTDFFFFPLSPASLESPDLTDTAQYSPLHASILLPILLA